MIKLIHVLALAGLIFIVSGCATKKVDWQSRVGRYNYDQAVVDMGPPDKTAKLSDGTTVAEWQKTRESRVSFGLGFGVSRGSVGGGVGVPLGGDSVDTVRLTFGPDGILQASSDAGKNPDSLAEPAGASNASNPKE